MEEDKQVPIAKLLVDRCYFESFSLATRWVRRGRVIVGGKRVYSPETPVDSSSQLRILNRDKEYISRGGVKLEHALEHFDADVEGKVCLDVGSSTGGFTDCLLAFGASKVYAVDVGYGILDWELRNHPSVVVMERMNARDLTFLDIPESVDIVTADLSFISLTVVLPPVSKLVTESGEIFALLKPQFEIPRAWTGEEGFTDGVIESGELLKRVTSRCLQGLAKRGLSARGIVESPIRGAKGNRELFIWLKRPFNEPVSLDCDSMF